MQKLFYGVVMSFILVFLYWTAMYFVQGYNLTDNVGHLDFKSMTNTLSAANSVSIYDYIFKPIENLNNLFKNGFNLSNYGGSDGFKVVLNAINYLLKFTYIIYQPVYYVSSILINFVKMLEPVTDFVSVVLRFMLYPKFI